MIRNSIILILVVFSCIGSVLSQVDHLKGMTFIEGGDFIMNLNVIPTLDEKVDTTYLYYSNLDKKSISNFYLSKHEVTNGEYWEFIHWVQDSMARKELFLISDSIHKTKWGNYVNYKTYNVDAAGRYFVLNWNTPVNISYYSNGIDFEVLENSQLISSKHSLNELMYCYEYKNEESGELIHDIIEIYPNTSKWEEEFPYGPGDIKNYFSAEWYKNFPVVGVSWIQANAYCHWRTCQFRKNYDNLSRKQKKYFSSSSSFRLPSETEWENSTIDFEEQNHWHIEYEKKDGKYQTNFGPIYLKSDIQIKSYMDDGADITSSVGSYLPNKQGIYDLFGNVSEWTSDAISSEDCEYKILEKRLPVNSDNKLINITNPYSKETILVVKESDEHLNILKLRLKYYEINPKDSKEEMMKKYLAFHSIDSNYYDSVILVNNRQSTITITDVYGNKSADFHFRDILGFKGSKQIIYDNYGGFFDRFSYYDSLKLESKIIKYKHDNAVLSRASNYQSHLYQLKNRIVKGGSWADQPHYLYRGARLVYNEAESSCKVGFRIAMDAPANTEFLNFKDKKRLKKLQKLKTKNNLY
jgi:sulfatase modifying factor 1